jgi:MFS family permease
MPHCRAVRLDTGRKPIHPFHETKLFASSLAALVYQVLWIKQRSLVVGVDVHAVSTAVSAFFAGLAIGGYIFGRCADRLERSLRLYAILEIGIAALGIGATLALAHAAPLFALLETRTGGLAWLLPFALVGMPAALMGGTLPVLMSAVAPEAGQLGGAGGRLYAANTAGAIAGALLTSCSSLRSVCTVRRLPQVRSMWRPPSPRSRLSAAPLRAAPFARRLRRQTTVRPAHLSR